MAAPWRSQLRQASFRGVGFYISGRDVASGRRVVTHEYPGRDTPYTEDMGRKARVWTIEGYVVGPDYMRGRDALQRACEAADAATLITPWSGEVQVVCSECRLREENTQGGYAVFSLTFAEAGSASTPAGQPRSGALADKRATGTMQVCGDELDRTVRIVSVPAPVLQATLEAMQDVAAAARRIRCTDAGETGFVQHLAASGRLTVSELVRYAPSLILSPFFSPAPDAVPTVAQSRELLAVAQAAPVAAVPVGAGYVRTVTAQNKQAIAAYQHYAAVAEAARAAALCVPESRSQADALRVAIVDAVDSVLERTGSPQVAGAFIDLRAAAVRALAESAGRAPQVYVMHTAAVLPSLLAAHKAVQGRSALQAEADLLTRNNIVHPGFVPPQALEVLRRV
ncbi:DNA circularization protein [Oleidesulfovibrio alaskensis]|uniref:DNA circularization protein n=1 Tax=Oleidesulfovibrio alaskensis TaxID=58180 RepID=UPI001A438B77|nr:DNA circularization N-terminal domain-containing protein [Oleidesulfovibrio alaskensis]MBL3582631.1 DNA circularization N-terminal domain-containing protein [Oleidesulfovibrio alaskensis]